MAITERSRRRVGILGPVRRRERWTPTRVRPRTPSRCQRRVGAGQRRRGGEGGWLRPPRGETEVGGARALVTVDDRGRGAPPSRRSGSRGGATSRCRSWCSCTLRVWVGAGERLQGSRQVRRNARRARAGCFGTVGGLPRLARSRPRGGPGALHAARRSRRPIRSSGRDPQPGQVAADQVAHPDAAEGVHHEAVPVVVLRTLGARRERHQQRVAREGEGDPGRATQRPAQQHHRQPDHAHRPERVVEGNEVPQARVGEKRNCRPATRLVCRADWTCQINTNWCQSTAAP